MGLTSKGTGVAAAKVTPLNPSLFPTVLKSWLKVSALFPPKKQLELIHKPELIPIAEKSAAVIEPPVTVKELENIVSQAKGLVPSTAEPKPAGNEVNSSEVAAPVALSFSPPIVPVTVPGTFPVTLLKEKVKSRALAAFALAKQTKIAANPPPFCQYSAFLTYFHDFR